MIVNIWDEIYLLHQDWCEWGYTDPKIKCYLHYEDALEKLNKVRDEFIEDKRPEEIEVDDIDCKRWQDNEYVFDIYITKWKIIWKEKN